MLTDFNISDITLNEALGLLLGMSITHIRSGNFTHLLGDIEQDISYECEKLEKVTNSVDKKSLEDKIELLVMRHDYAGNIHRQLCGEVANIRAQKPSSITLVKDTHNSTGYDGVKISAQSVYDWADEKKILISKPAKTSQHTTPLLELLNELKEEFWEDHDPSNPPKNDTIEAYVRDKYGEYTRRAKNAKNICDIAGVSKKVLESMCTIMRPPK